MENYVTIKPSKELDFISNHLSTPKDVLIESLIQNFEASGMIENGSDDWGKTVQDIVDEWEITPIGLCVLFLKTPEPSIINAFMSLVFIKNEGDCPECGGILQERTWGPDPAKSSDDLVCDYCGNETKPMGFEIDFENFIKH